MFKVNNKNTRATFIDVALMFFTVSFEHISHLLLGFLLLNLNKDSHLLLVFLLLNLNKEMLAWCLRETLIGGVCRTQTNNCRGGFLRK